jgi:hypothetical protein
MENFCPQQLNIIEMNGNIIMEQPVIDYYRNKFADTDDDYRRCSIVFDEAKIEIGDVANFGSNYDLESDIYFANPRCGQVTTYMVKGIFIEWWFIIQIIFHQTSSQSTIEDELNDIRDFIVQQLDLIPVIYLADMACRCI